MLTFQRPAQISSALQNIKLSLTPRVRRSFLWAAVVCNPCATWLRPLALEDRSWRAESHPQRVLYVAGVTGGVHGTYREVSNRLIQWLSGQAGLLPLPLFLTPFF